MRLRLLILCLGLGAIVGVGEARAAQADTDACQRDNLWAEQVLFAEAELPPAAEAPVVDDARCGPDRESADDCIDGPGLSAPRRGAWLRCDVRFGGAPRLHLRLPGARPSPWDRAVLGAPPGRVQAAGPQEILKAGGRPLPALLGAGLRPPAPPAPRLHRLAPEERPLLPGHRQRTFRPPR